MSSNLHWYAAICTFLWAKNWFESYLLNFHSKVIISTFYEEITVHSPIGSIGIPNNPIASASLFFFTPSNNDYGVVHIHPGDAPIIEGPVTQVLSLDLILFIGVFTFLFSLFLIFILCSGWLHLSQHNVLLVLFVDIYKTFLAKYTFFINTKHTWCLEIAINWTIPKDFLHHFFLWGVTPATSDKVRFLYLWNRFALFIVFAIVSLCFMNVWRAFLWDQMSVFRHEDVEMGPATVTSLVHIITGHKHLWWKHWWLLSIFEFDSCFHDLCHWNGVAWTAFALVPKVTCEIVTIDITIVKFFRDFTVWDILWIAIFFLP